MKIHSVFSQQNSTLVVGHVGASPDFMGVQKSFVIGEALQDVRARANWKATSYFENRLQTKNISKLNANLLNVLK